MSDGVNGTAAGRDSPRVLVVHDYFTQRGGAERVALALARALKSSGLMTSVFSAPSTYPEVQKLAPQVSVLNRVPLFRREPRAALPLLALVFSRMRPKGADVVVCSSSGWSHGVRSTAPVVVYCHNPARWLYQASEYALEMPAPARGVLRILRPVLTRWDKRAASRATLYIANSTAVAERVRRTYGRPSIVVPPPTGLSPHGDQQPVKGLEPGFLLTIGRPRGYKNTAAVATAIASMPGCRLVAVGGLPPGNWPPTLTGVVNVTDSELRWLYANAAGLVACSYEDFGLTPVEGYRFGTPAVVLRAGGYLDTTLPGITGVFAESTKPADIRAAVEVLLATDYDTDAIRVHGEQYSEHAFAKRMQDIVAGVHAYASGTGGIDLREGVVDLVASLEARLAAVPR